jgi:hypothetical protein
MHQMAADGSGSKPAAALPGPRQRFQARGSKKTGARPVFLIQMIAGFSTSALNIWR